MAFAQLGYAVDLDGLATAPKLVLIMLAARACGVCGLAWPGLGYFEQKTGLKRTRITEALDELKAQDLVRVHRYERGGRGRTTEYVVLPQVFGFSTAPCGKCVENLKPGANLPPRGRNTVKEPSNIPPRGRISVVESSNLPENASETYRHAVGNQSGETISHAPARAKDAPPSAPRDETALEPPPARSEAISRNLAASAPKR